MSPFSRGTEHDALGRYWDALVRGAPPEELARLAQPLDPADLTLLAHWRALRQTRPPDPAFRQQLEQDLMHAFAMAQPNTVPLRTPLPSPRNGRAIAPARRAATPALPVPRQPTWSWFHSGLAVLLILAIVGAFFSYFRHDDRAIAPAIATPSPTTPAADWPMYRGNPSRTGAMAGPGPDGQPVEVWHFQTQGPASKSPAIAAGVVYLQSGDGLVYALDAATGAERWRVDLGGGPDTPAIVGDTLYVNDSQGALVALDAANGAERWRFTESISPSATPIVVAGVLFTASDEGRLFALDAATGQEQWQYDAGAGIGRSAAVAAGLVYLGTDNGALRVVDAATGAERWRFDSDEITEPALTPTVANGVVYAAIGSTLYAFDAVDGTEHWRSTFDGARPVTTAGDTLYTLGLDGMVYALNPADGAVRWTFNTGAASQAGPAPALVSDTLYAAGGDHALYALDAATGAARWDIPLDDGQVEYGPSVANGMLYVGTQLGNLYAFGGSGMAQLMAPSAPQGTPTPMAASTSPATGTTAAAAASPWQTTGGPQPLLAPAGAAVDADGNIWVVDAANDLIQIIAPDGRFVEAWDGTSGGGAPFSFAKSGGGYDGDIAFAPDGRIYVAEAGGSSHRVQVFDRDRTWLATWDAFGTGEGQFIEPESIAVDAQGTVYLKDRQQSRVQKFDPDGNFLLNIGGPDEQDGGLGIDGYITVDGQGNVLVAGYSTNEIVKFASDGTLLARWGEFGGEPGQFRTPVDVAVDAFGNTYVADGDNGRIQILDAQGRPLAVWDAGTTPSGAKNLPYAVALDGEGNLYVIGTAPDGNSEGNVQKFRVVPSLVPVAMATPQA